MSKIFILIFLLPVFLMASSELTQGRQVIQGILYKSANGTITMHINPMSKSKMRLVVKNFPIQNDEVNFPRIAKLEVLVESNLINGIGIVNFIKELD